VTSDFTVRPYGLLGDLGPGSRIAGYVVEEQVGAGGMAVVFRARDEVLGRLAAVKVIAPAMAGDPEFRARFLRESRAVAAVSSRHIIPVYGAGEAGGTLYIATRFAAGGDLAALARRAGGLLAPGRAAALVAQVASALDAAHAAGLVHRDVKPQNVLVDSTPELAEHAFLSDFGLIKATGSSSTGLTAAGQFVGTPEYCAPEQVRGAAVDGRADQYALGCVAFALLTGQAPFHRSETVATLYAQVHDPVPSLCAVRPGLPPAVDHVIARALAKSPDGRYARCGEFAAALQAALASPRPAAGDAPEIARTQLDLPPHPSNPALPALPAFTTQSGAAALRDSGGHASTADGGSGDAGRPPPPPASGRGNQPKRLSGRTALVAGTVAVTLAAAAAVLIYAERPAGPSQGAPASPSLGAGPASASPTPSASRSPGSAIHPGSPSPARTGASPTTATGTVKTVRGKVPGKVPGQVPGQVTGVTATAGDGLAVLKWQAAPGKPTGYQVAVSPAPAGGGGLQQLGTATSDTVTGLTNGTTYTFTVAATDAAGNGPRSLAVTAVPVGKPVATAPPLVTDTGSNGASSIIEVSAETGSNPNGSPVQYYTVYEYEASSSSGPFGGTPVASGEQAPHGGNISLPKFTVSNDGSWYEYAYTVTTAAGTSALSPLSSPALQVPVASTTSSPTAAP
jgi:serine/threonine protein kinase